jgi:hypothetical protein
LGIWVASHRRPLHPRRCIVLHTNGGNGQMGRIAPPLRRFGDRCAVSDVLSENQVRSIFDELARYLGTKDISPNCGLGPRVIGGFKSGSAYLGRPALLPRIEAPEGGRLRLLNPLVEEDSAEVTLSPDGQHRLSVLHVLSGPHLLRYEEQPLEGVEPLVWQKSLVFVPSAYEHANLSNPDSNHWILPEEYVAEAGSAVPIVFEDESTSEALGADDGELAQRFDDFLEALYASGRSGWTESELIEVMREVLGPNRPSPWDVLRSLEESTWLVCRSAIAWRARRWWLLPPKLFASPEPGQMIVILGGSSPEAVRRRFFATATNLGASFEERHGVGPCSPRFCVARGVEPQLLARELGWCLESLPEWPVSPAPHGWPRDASDPGSHELAGRWNWRLGRFVPSSVFTAEVVRLERFTRARKDRCDLFAVSGGNSSNQWVSSSRVVAIVEAHRRARAPLFSIEGNRLTRMSRDGHMPLPLALATCLRLGRTSGPVRSRDGWTYAYPADAWIVEAFRRTFGSAIVSGGRSPVDNGPTAAELIGRRRRRSQFSALRGRGGFLVTGH